MKNVERPQAEEGKIHSKNEFELCYLRHQYFRRAKLNPTKDEMAPFSAIAVHMAKNTFFTYKGLFRIVGFELEDVISISNVHLVSFLGLFSMEQMPKKYDDFVLAHKIDKGRKPNKNDILQKNRANLTIFLKQRMEDVVRVCRQKARNIKGLPVEEYQFFCGPNKPPKRLRELFEDHERYGYKKLDSAVYKSIKKRLNVEESPSYEVGRKVFKFSGVYYVAVPMEQKILSMTDFVGAGMDPYDSIHNMSPEQIFFSAEDARQWEKKKTAFNKTSKPFKAAIIKEFIDKNKENPRFKSEIETAKRLLKRYGGAECRG